MSDLNEFLLIEFFTKKKTQNVKCRSYYFIHMKVDNHLSKRSIHLLIIYCFVFFSNITPIYITLSYR